MGFLSNLRKHWKLMRLMKRIGKEETHEDLYSELLSTGLSDIKVAENELFELVFNDTEIRAILDKYQTSREGIEEYYRKLCLSGGCKWVGGSYVAAVSIAFKPTLIYMLQAAKAPLPEGWSENSRWIKITVDLIHYFEFGRLGSLQS